MEGCAGSGSQVDGAWYAQGAAATVTGTFVLMLRPPNSMVNIDSEGDSKGWNRRLAAITPEEERVEGRLPLRWDGVN